MICWWIALTYTNQSNIERSTLSSRTVVLSQDTIHIFIFKSLRTIISRVMSQSLQIVYLFNLFCLLKLNKFSLSSQIKLIVKLVTELSTHKNYVSWDFRAVRIHFRRMTLRSRDYDRDDESSTKLCSIIVLFLNCAASESSTWACDEFELSTRCVWRQRVNLELHSNQEDF